MTSAPFAAVPGEVPCGTTRPGVRCAHNPCDAAACPATPAAACVPFFCQQAVQFRGANITQRPCTAVFVDSDTGSLVDCEAARPLLDSTARRGANNSSSGGSGGGQAAAMGAFAKAAAALATGGGGGGASLWQTLLNSGQAASKCFGHPGTKHGHMNRPISYAAGSATPLASMSCEDIVEGLWCSAGGVADIVAAALASQGISAPPERQAAFADCVQDALRGGNASALTSTVAVQALQGFISGNG